MKRFLLVYEGKQMFLLLKIIHCRKESEVSWLKRCSWKHKKGSVMKNRESKY